jgi:hypothetical protein
MKEDFIPTDHVAQVAAWDEETSRDKGQRIQICATGGDYT